MDTRLKIGFFIDTYFPMVDGVIMTVDNYAKRLSPVADVTVFTTVTDKHYIDAHNYRVVRSRSVSLKGSDYRMPLPELDFHFISELKRAKLDIIHIHSPFAIGKAGMRYAKEHGIPVVATIHSQYKLEFLRALKYEALASVALRNMMRLFEEADECWAPHAEMARVYREEYGGRHIPTIRGNATDMLPCKDRAAGRAFVNRKCGLSENDTVFLFVGRLNLLKNILFIVDALKLVREMSDIPFKMLFVGAGQDEDKLRKRIEETGMGDSILLCGRVDDREELACFYARADLFLFPSLFDTYSLVQIEAASQKTPALFIKGSVTGSVVQDNVNGFLAENSASRYAQRIIEIMKDDALRGSVSEGAYRDLYRTWDNEVEAAYQDYRRLVSRLKQERICK